MSEYPGALITFTTKTNKVDLVDAAHINSLQDEVAAIEAELGIDVAGSEADLKTRLYICIGNDGALRQGTSFPGTTRSGQLFFKTDDDLVYVRNAADDAWDAWYLADAAVSQAKLKTSSGEVSHAGGASGAAVMLADMTTNVLGLWTIATWTTTYATRLSFLFADPTGGQLKTLPGGTYGFYPQFKGVTTGGPIYTYYAQQRYVTASGKDHWIFLLIDKITREIVSGYQAPDHPCYGSSGTEEDTPHPFPGYDESKYEIVLIDNEILNQTKLQITSRRSLLTVIHEEYELDPVSIPIYQPREIIEIDEYGDKPGEIIKEMKTPEWAKVVIGSDKIYLKKRMVNVLPAMVGYKKLKKKA